MDGLDLLSFPNEVLSCVFAVTSVKDLQNLRLTCRRFLHVIQDSNKFWKLKVIGVLQRMSSVCYPVGEIPLAVINKLVIPEECPIPVEWIEEILVELIFDKKLNENLTVKFYARKLLVHLRTRSLERKLSNWISSSEPQKSFLEGAIIVSQYSQMEKDNLTSLRDTVEKHLECITNRVKELDAGKADDNCKEKKILASIHQVMFSEMGFVKQYLRDDSSFDNFYIDKVLESKRGNMLILSIIYKEVANRLGIPIEFVYSDISDSILIQLRWSDLENECTCITLAGGDLLQDTNDPTNAHVYSVIPAQQAFKWLCSKLVQCSSQQIRERDAETDKKFGDDYSNRFLYVFRSRNFIKFRRLACAISPDADTVLRYAYSVQDSGLVSGIQVEEANQFLQSNEAFMKEDPQHKFFLDHTLKVQIAIQKYLKLLAVKDRNPSTECAVGLVVIYTSIYTGATIVGVIASRQDRKFQHVLLEGGDSYYSSYKSTDFLPEYDLQLHPSGTTVNHPMIGLYFERFDGHRYIPNAEVKAAFPDDEAFTSSLFLSNRFAENSLLLKRFHGNLLRLEIV